MTSCFVAGSSRETLDKEKFQIRICEAFFGLGCKVFGRLASVDFGLRHFAIEPSTYPLSTYTKPDVEGKSIKLYHDIGTLMAF